MPKFVLRKRFALKLGFVFLFSAIHLTCSNYHSISSPVGRQAMLDDANNYLTAGHCDEAIDVLDPLYHSEYVDYEIRMTFASAYACRGGLNFASLAAAINGFGGGDIWSLLVGSNYSQNSSDGKVAALLTAASIVNTTSTNGGGYEASTRKPDANVYMIFLQANIIATTISVDSMGRANSTTGKKTQLITGSGTNEELCRLETALATIADSALFVTTSATMTSLTNSINSACGGACPTNKDPTVCTAAEQLQGAAIVVGIDSQWGL